MKAHIVESCFEVPEIVCKRQGTDIIGCDDFAEALQKIVDVDKITVYCDAEDFGMWDKLWDVTLIYRGVEYQTWFTTQDIAYINRDGAVKIPMFVLNN